jgi:ubiquinone/menaquinone biosynthesis C-methylase UbiE
MLKKLINCFFRWFGYVLIPKKTYDTIHDNINRRDKEQDEVFHWKEHLVNCVNWYDGNITSLWGEPAPDEKDKVKTGFSHTDNALLTWINVHQKKKYLADLMLDRTAFSGMKLLDIGSGAYPSASVFEKTKVYCLDPLMPEYMKVGYPLHYFSDVHFVYGFSEKIPFPDNYFDAIISVNAIDHVNNFEDTVKEIKRVLNTEGLIRLHIHYHKSTVCEPLELNDRIVSEQFKWCKNFRKINQSKHKYGNELENADEFYALWSNF